MKQIWINLKSREHQHALIAVSVVIMGAILFFLLVSLEAPIAEEKQTDLAVEISAFEISSTAALSASSSAQTHTSAQTQKEETINMVRQNSETKETPVVNDLFQFKSNEAGHSNERFGKDDLTLIDKINGPSPSKREVVKAPYFNANTQEEGTIGLLIWVDAEGKVVRTALDPAASNSGSSFLIQLAKKAALSMQFNSKPNASVECAGTSIFVFKKG